MNTQNVAQTDPSRGLFWVKGELSQTLQRVRVQIESYLEDGSHDRLPLERSLVDLQQISSIAGIIQVYSVALLAEEMREALQDTLRHPERDADASFSALVAATLQLTDYMDLLAHGEADHPLIFSQSINELRVSRGAPLYSRAVLFSRYLEVRGLEVEPPASAHRKPGMSRALAGKHADVMQKAVLGAIRGENRERALTVLAKASDQLASVAVDARVYLCWRGVSLMALVLRGNPEVASPEVHKLLAKTGQCVKALASNGEASIARAAGLLGEQALHLGMFVQGEDAQVSAILAELGLDPAMLSEAHLEQLRARLTQPNIESLQTVTREIRNNLLDIKDSIDLAVRSGSARHSAQGLIEGLNTIGSTLSVLGLDALGRLAQQQAEQIAGFGDEVSEDQWMHVAEILLRIEQGLDAELMPKRKSALVESGAHHDLKEGVGAVLRESLVNITRIKSEIDQFIARGQPAALEAAARMSAEIGSAFNLLGSDKAVASFARVSSCLNPTHLAGIRDRSLVADSLADIIAAMEYFLEAVQENEPNTDRLLDDIDRYVERLDEVLVGAGVTPEETVAAPVAPVVQEEVDPEFRDIFIEESGEVLAELQALMPRWTQNPSDDELLGSVRRAFHTLKGSGRMVGASEIGEFAWLVEDLLNRCRDGALPLSSQVTEVVGQAVEALPAIIERFAQAASALDLVAPLQASLHRALGQDDEPADDDVLSLFLEDAGGYLSELQARIQDRDACAVDEALVRLLHTLRGAAGTAGVEATQALAGAGERYLQSLFAHGQPADASLLRQIHQELSLQVQAVQAGETPSPATELLDEIERLVKHLQTDEGFDAELAEIFAEEAASLLEQAESELQDWTTQPDSTVAQANLQRIFHTLKGSARTAGAYGLGQVGEALDALMKAVLVGEYTSIDQALFGRIGQSVLATYSLLDAFREGRDADPGVVLALLNGEGVAAPEAGIAEDIPALEPEPEPEAVEPSIPPQEFEAPLAEPVIEAVEPAPAPAPAEDLENWDVADAWPPDPELLELFEGEAQDLLESIDQHFTVWEDEPQLTEPLRALQRDLHTFKGGARMTGLNSLGAVAHEMETLFAAAEAGQVLDAGTFGRLHRAVDGLHQLLAGVKAGVPPSAAADLLADLRSGDVRPQGPALSSVELAAEPVADLGDTTEAGLDPELVEIFLPEGQELMESFDASCAALRADGGDREALAEMLRVLHTLKGGARMAALSDLGNEVHELESGLEALSAHGQTLDGPWQDRLQQASDSFHQHLAEAKRILQGGGVEPSAAVPPAQPQVEAPAVPSAAPAAVEPLDEPAKSWSSELAWEAPTDERLAAIRRETARVSVEQLDAMLNEAGEISIYRSRLERQVASFNTQLREMEQTIARIRDQLRMLETETDAQVQARTQGRQMDGAEGDRYGAEFDPLEMDRYSRMQELTRALSESVTDLSSLHNSMVNVTSETDTLLLQQGRVNTSVQQGLMSTLMVPFSRQVQRLQRVLRQTTTDNAKQAELVLNGIEAEMDRNVLERMTPVIEHIIRNCVIHGLENPQDRSAAGKPVQGTVSIDLTRDGSKLSIEIRDDGRGLDFKRIREKAIERGMMAADALLTEGELAQFIYQPGFSTAEALTQDAGRGVGMDVVASEIKQLGGTLELDSQVGKGTRFVIRLPLSLAISQSLLVQVADQVYAAPLGTIEGIARLPMNEVEKCLADEQFFQYGNNDYKVRYLGQLLGLEGQPPADRDHLPVILVHTGEGMGLSDRRVAVVVDQLLGSRELVTKTAGPQVSTVVGVTGATIQADGRVVLILDMVALVEDQLRRALQGAVVHEAGDQPVKAAHQLTVMVIDDSITMRRVAERLLTRNGYRVTTAKDGMDGIAQLQTEAPDAVLLDIEMPKVDGFEVATFIRNNPQLSQLPIIMITSRSGEKHRERAAAIGVNRYLIKPYQEQQLLTELREVMTAEA